MSLYPSLKVSMNVTRKVNYGGILIQYEGEDTGIGLLFASPQKYNWNDAKKFCRTKSGILALGNDAATWEAILNNFEEDVYVGLSNPDGESCKNGNCKNTLFW